MDRRLLAIAVLVMGLAAIAGATQPAVARVNARFGNRQATSEPQREPSPASPCFTAVPSADAGTEPTVAAQLPAGISFTLLASGVAEKVPSAPVSLVLTRVTLAASAGTETRLSSGTLVFYVEAGIVTFYIDGAPSDVEAGGMAMVQQDGLYAYANQGSEPASLLRLGLVPRSGDDGPIMVVPTTMPVFAESSVPPESESLVRAVLPQPPQPGDRLFLACVAWSQGEALLDQGSTTGSIGLWVVIGQLRLDDTVVLDPGGCTLIQAGRARRLGAGMSPPSVLVFGTAAEGSRLWSTTNAVVPGSPSDPLDLRCGEV